MSSPLIFSADSLAASGGAIDIECRGQGPMRLYIRAVTGTLDSLAVSIGDDTDHLVGITSSVFDSLSAGVTEQLLIPEPVGIMRLTPTGNHYDVRLAVALSQGF